MEEEKEEHLERQGKEGTQVAAELDILERDNLTSLGKMERRDLSRKNPLIRHTNEKEGDTEEW